jgi:hypothetical protein
LKGIFAPVLIRGLLPAEEDGAWEEFTDSEEELQVRLSRQARLC